jgi:hypothetical protein
MKTTFTRTNTTGDGSPMLLASGSVLCVIGALAYASVVVLQPDASDRDAFASPTSIAGSLAATTGLALVLVWLVTRPGTPVGWPLRVVAVGVAFTMAAAYFSGTVAVGIGDHTSDAQFEDIGTSGWTMLLMLPKMILCLIGFVSWAVQGRRSGHLSRSSGLVLGAAGLASVLPPFAPGVLLFGIAVGLIAHRANDTSPDRSAVTMAPRAS